MRLFILTSAVAASMLFLGCSSKKYFEPKQAFSAEKALQHYDGVIVDISRDGATLADGRFIDKHGISKIKLQEGYYFLSESGRYVLAGNDQGMLKVIDRKSGKVIKEISFDMPVVSASIKNGLIAYILNSNAFGVYSLAQNKKVTENRSERTFAIDARAASPLFIDTLVVMPVLDGKLIIFDVNEPELYKVVYLSSDKVFNNIVYLTRSGDTLVAATPKKLLTLGTEGEFTKRANIAEIAVSQGDIYLFSKEGEIVKFDTLLSEKAKQKFKFAQYSAATVYHNKVYALDKQGSLIVLDPSLKHYKIYDVGEVESPVFIADGKLYKDGVIIQLDQLGY